MVIVVVASIVVEAGAFLAGTWFSGSNNVRGTDDTFFTTSPPIDEVVDEDGKDIFDDIFCSDESVFPRSVPKGLFALGETAGEAAGDDDDDKNPAVESDDAD